LITIQQDTGLQVTQFLLILHFMNLFTDVAISVGTMCRFWGAMKVVNCAPDIRRTFAICVKNCWKRDCRSFTRLVTSFRFTSV